MIMENQAPSIAKNRKNNAGGTVRFLFTVISVGALLATLFTAWTQPGLLPGRLSDRLGSSIILQASTPSDNNPTPTARPNPRIGIVAGHSGNDPGAVCSEALGGIREVDVNLDIANRVRDYLRTNGYDVELLSEFDPRLTNYRAQALVSIHADSCDFINDEATGFKVASAASNYYPEQSARLTNCLRARYEDITGMEFHAGSVTEDMTDYHAFREIHNQTPAAIIEVGFLNRDHQTLTEKPDLLAKGITAGIYCFLLNEDISLEVTPIP